MTKDAGRDSLSISHAKELHDAAHEIFSNRISCRMMLTKGTKSGVTKGGITSAVDQDFWMVTEFSGSLEAGFSLLFKRVPHS